MISRIVDSVGTNCSFESIPSRLLSLLVISACNALEARETAWSEERLFTKAAASSTRLFTCHLARCDFFELQKMRFPLRDGAINVFFSLLNGLLASFHIAAEIFDCNVQEFKFCISDDIIKFRLQRVNVLSLGFDALDPSNPKARGYLASYLMHTSLGA